MRRHKQAAVSQVEAYRATLEAFRKDPVLFCDKALGLQLDEYQGQALRYLADDPRAQVAVRAARGSGKTFGIEAPAIAWFMTCFAPCRIITTAPTWYQVEQLLWRDLSGHSNRKVKFGGKLLTTSWEMPGDRFATGVSPDRPERVEGPHSENVLIVIDEAKAVTRDVRRRLRGSFSTCTRANELACSTPWDKSSAFFEDCTSREWKHVHIPAHKSKWIKPEWIEKCKREWGEDSPLYQSQVLAEFVDISETALVALDWIERARMGGAKHDEDEAVVIGVDVARFGTDNSAIYTRSGSHVLSADTIHGEDTMALANRVAAMFHRTDAGLAMVDSTGIGSGVADRLREMGFTCEDFDAGAGAYDEEKYKNCRAEAYWNLRERFREGRIDLSQIPEARYRALLEELTTLEYSYTEGGRILIEPKEKWRKRTAAASEERVAHSPDDADALAIAFYQSAESRTSFSLSEIALGVQGDKRVTNA